MAKQKQPSNRRNMTIAGIMLFFAGSIVLMGVITGEIFYPDQYKYTTAKSMISDLGATEPPNSIITQPSATIFNTAMMAAGILVLIGTYFVFRTYNDPIATIFMGLLGLGILGVGIFPGNMNPMHPLFALTAFLGGGLAAISSYRIIYSPYKYVAVILGLTTLVFLFGNGYFSPILGAGGAERWVAYPVILWIVGLGGYLLGFGAQKGTKTS